MMLLRSVINGYYKPFTPKINIPFPKKMDKFSLL